MGIGFTIRSHVSLMALQPQIVFYLGEAPVKMVQFWRYYFTLRYLISSYKFKTLN